MFDGAYANQTVIGACLDPTKGRRIDVVTRLRFDARLYEPVPERDTPRRGRPRLWGRRLPAPQDHAKWTSPWQSGTAFVYGRRRSVRFRELTCRWAVSGPGEPLPDEYDLLIYSKNRHRPGLLEHLCEVFPRHVVLHYGQYLREQLFEAARRSRACAYLADDDHGLLALQEILLTRSPVAGVRTGAPFIQDGVTGIFVERLPSGAECVKNDTDEAATAELREQLTQAEHDRDATRAALAAPKVDASLDAPPRGGHSLDFRDPAGNSVKLITPGVWGIPAGW